MIIENAVDIITGLQYGDEGKGKITASLVEQKRYEITARYNGGPNAGHSIHKQNGAHYELHQLPSSIPFQEMGLIGPGCVLDINKLAEEVEEFKKVEGFDPLPYLYIDPEVSLIDDSHLKLDEEYHFKNQGSTKKGIAPAYSDYYNRTGKTFKSLEKHLQNYCFLEKRLHDIDTLLLEGAQGFYLNPHSGNYPYVTSSSSHPGAAASTFGFDPKKLNNIIGVAKCYETRSGQDPTFYNAFEAGSFLNTKVDFSDEDLLNFQKIQVEGKEYGVTTGRKRHIRYLCLERLINAIQSTGTNIVVINKWDILQKLNIYKIIVKDKIIEFKNFIDMFNFIKNNIKCFCPQVTATIYSASQYSDIEWKDYV